MMQHVASAKADVAAFAALSATNEQPDPSLAFEQVLKQQQHAAPPTKRVANSDVPSSVKTEISPVVRNSGSSPASAQSAHTTDKNPPSKDALNIGQAEQQSKLLNGTHQGEQDELSALDGSSGEAVLINDSEQWLGLVWSLQQSSLDEQQTPSAEIPHSGELDSIQALQLWLESKDDKLQALTQLLEANPGLQTWLTEADLPQGEELHSLIGLLLSGREGGTQDEALTNKLDMSTYLWQKNGQQPGADGGPGLKQGRLQIGQDKAALIDNERLSAADIELLKQTLAGDVSQNTDLDKTFKDGLQLQAEAKLAAGGRGVEQNQGMPNNSTIMATAKQDEQSVISASGKFVVPIQSVSEALQNLLNEISGSNKTPAELSKVTNSISQALQEAQRLDARSFAGDPALESLKDKLTLSKEAASHPVVHKADTASLTADSHTNVKALLALSDAELEKALNSLAQRLAVLWRNTAQPQTGSLSQAAGNADTMVTQSSKEVLAALKAGLTEFKQQLAAGHEPGLDLQSLVTQALQKSTDSSVLAKVAEGMDKGGRPLSLASINQINDGAGISQVYSAVSLDSQMTQAEQHKTLQLNQFENKLDKALNLHKPDSHQQLADKVRWMVNTGNLIADIRLDPAELGSVHVKVSLSAESATVNFVVQSQQTKDALEAASPKLREMLAEKGIELGQSTVKQDSQTKQDNQGQAGQQTRHGSTAEPDEAFIEDDNRLINQTGLNSGASNTIDYFV